MIEKFLILTHVSHFQNRKRFFAYAPYVKEMNLWLASVNEVKIVAPESNVQEDLIEQYQHENITFSKISAFNILSGKQLFLSIVKIPVIGLKIFRAMKSADHLHLRCPGNIGLLACVCQIFFRSKSKSAKYAGNWDPKSTQPFTYKLQKWILSNPFLTRNMQVLVYGEWSRQSKNVVPFFTASFSEKVKKEVKIKDLNNSLTFLYVGNLVPGKNPLLAIQLIQRIASCCNREVKMEIYGDGPERKRLKNYCMQENLQDVVCFLGAKPLEDLKDAYQKAQFVILPSQSEGWPKAIAEGMFFGCIPIATRVSCIPWMLNDGKRGIILSPVSDKAANVEEWLEGAVKNVVNLLGDFEEMQRMSYAAREWSQQYTLERFDAAIQKILAPQSLKI